LSDQVLDTVLPSGKGGGRRSHPFRKATGAGFLVALWALASTGGSQGEVGDPAPFQKGMVLGIFSKTDPDYFHRSLEEIQRLGVDSISLIVPKVQKDVHSTGFYDDPWITPSEASLRQAIREAHRRGMRIFLMPIVYLEDLRDGEWRGTLEPGDWGAWFEAYEKMIMGYARLASEERVEYFSVGSELCSTERMKSRWERVIRKVRRVFPGQITYSANWDHLEPVSFGSRLDFLGMNAYYEVGKDSASEPEAMVARWKEIQKGIRSWRKLNGNKPLVITEVGYPSRTGAGVDPWNYFGEGAPDPETQRKCYEAFVTAWNGETMLSGVYFYLWWGEGGLQDRDYTPRGKPAQRVIESWYSGEGKLGGSSGLLEVKP
jgi:glycosyl hydrolase family 113